MIKEDDGSYTYMRRCSAGHFPQKEIIFIIQTAGGLALLPFLGLSYSSDQPLSPW